mmetsp:Transcript_27614/g.108236  ORF Transcript_27614/g.108236 Transcript_27614/m.108236 type:complete len:342 (-) Transcript_27614:554-1579(-)|eukprot:CAMPEP_0113961774 /NCGR_PEP_ID=MMETSP0011_2-20120614/5516_1 /TAXON_ID=101924 /ORGANISM="Rhodosorus marinus" /LENGTH=341 /DNA_ID=CAMNT_0000973493 /DNA_START=705 /DNA_END=1730 /DNA_ORIENTATION=+ /assembly_acc=CAM_ASM_000156
MYNFRNLDGRKVETRRRAANKRIGQHIAGAGLKAWMVGLVGVVALGVVLFLTLVPRSQRGNRIPVFPHGHRYIFVASPGRAGSGFLRNVFGCAKGVLSRHEPGPKMNGHVLEEVLLRGRRQESFPRRSEEKLKGISEDLLGYPMGTAYVETSHMMIKTFLDVVLDSLAAAGVQVDIVILHRNPLETIRSQLRLGWFHSSHSGRNSWYFSVSDLHPTERMGISIRKDALSTKYPRLAEVVAYNADHEWRVKSIIRKMESGILPPSVKISQVNLEDLSEISSVGAFLESLNLEVDDAKLALLFSMDKNSRDRKKKDMLSQAEDSVLPSILDSYSLTSGKRKAL